jgi:hypothetical protein
MREMINQRVPVMTRTERKRLAFLTSTHVVDDLYQGAIPALLPFLLRDPRRADRADEIPGPCPSTPMSE